MPGTGAISYPSYTWTRPDAVLYPGGGRREYEYDPLMRITRILAKDPGKNILLDYSYSYDNIDNIVQKQTGQGTYNYTYDALYRLTDVQVDIPGQENEGFSYDAVENRLSEQGVEGEWTYNDNNELLTFANTEYTYDANGNATQLLLDGTVMFTYHYNAQDRLVQVEDVNGNTIAEYYYDPFGRRLWKEVGGTKTYFFYADEGLVAEYDASGAEIRAYGYRPDSTWTTDPLWLKQGGEYYFYQNDHLGAPQKLVQMNGAIAWSASYTAFGKAAVEVETITSNLRLPGQYYDAETGLHYNWHRYYDAKNGRYLQTDPIGLEGGVNPFTYAHNTPLKYIDPQGRVAMVAALTWCFGTGVCQAAIAIAGAGVVAILTHYLIKWISPCVWEWWWDWEWWVRQPWRDRAKGFPKDQPLPKEPEDEPIFDPPFPYVPPEDTWEAWQPPPPKLPFKPDDPCFVAGQMCAKESNLPLIERMKACYIYVGCIITQLPGGPGETPFE